YQMPDNPIAPLIKKYAEQNNLEKEIVAGLIWQESRGETYAYRYEPDFFRRYLEGRKRTELNGFVPALLPTLESEKSARATSWGLMQIMGETARELGFNEQYLTRLLCPDVNISLGCDFLWQLLKRFETSDRALLAWNGGGDPAYPKKVRA